MRKPFEKRLSQIEGELDALGAEGTRTEAWLATPEAYEEGQREQLQVALRRRAEITERTKALEDDWLWAQAEMDRELERLRSGKAAG